MSNSIFGTYQFPRKYPNWPIIGRISYIKRGDLTYKALRQKYPREHVNERHGYYNLDPNRFALDKLNLVKCSQELRNIITEFCDNAGLDLQPSVLPNVRIDYSGNIARSIKNSLSDSPFKEGWHYDTSMARAMVTLYGPGTFYLGADSFGFSSKVCAPQTKRGEVMIIFGSQAYKFGLPPLFHRAPEVSTMRVTMLLSLTKRG